MNPEKKSGEWLEKALLNLCKNKETGIELDGEIISGLVSYCELAPPEDAQEYLNNIVGQEAGQSVIEEYMRRRGVTAISNNADAPASNMQAYIKPRQDYGFTTAPKKQPKIPREPSGSNSQANKIPSEAAESRNSKKGNASSSKKKKAGKVVSLAEAAKGTVVYKQGEPCSCQARRHKLVSNCLSCGKIVCEQEGEGPCSFCGALVLREGSTYAGLDETILPLSQTEVAAEAFAKRLVEYDRNSAARTTVIDDQSDYYELDGNKWLSAEEKELLTKKQQEIEEADQARRSKVVVTFDLVGRKVMLNEDEASEIGSESRILRPLDVKEVNRIKPNPTLNVQPVFVDVGRGRDRPQSKRPTNGLCLEITGRVQRDGSELQSSMEVGLQSTDSDGHPWQRPTVKDGLHVKDDYECSLDYN